MPAEWLVTEKYLAQRIIYDELAQVPEVQAAIKMEKLAKELRDFSRRERDVPQQSGTPYSSVPPPFISAVPTQGFFYDLVARKWKVIGVHQSMHPTDEHGVYEDRFYVTVVDAADENYGIRHLFQVSAEEYDRVDLGSVIDLNLTIDGA